VEIFARTLYEKGFMSEMDYSNYRMLFETMVEYLRKPDLIIFLQAPVEQLLDRILQRGRDYEQTIDRDYLNELNMAYDRWSEEAEENGLRVLRVNTVNKNFEKRKTDLNTIVKFVREMENQSWIGMD
jgi:deoxyadenosine/deoxycytidine kinase